MRIMAIDFGEARTGVAVSDATRTLTGEAWVIQSKSIKETVRNIAGEAADRDVSCIIVGYPKNMDGSIGERAIKSENFASMLKEACADGISGKVPEIVLWDERLTTKDAHRILTDAGKRGNKRKQTIDAVAASLILESYLDR